MSHMRSANSDITAYRHSNDEAMFHEEGSGNALLLLAQATSYCEQQQVFVSPEVSPASTTSSESSSNTHPLVLYPKISITSSSISSLEFLYPELMLLNISVQRDCLTQRWGFSIAKFDELCCVSGRVDTNVLLYNDGRAYELQHCNSTNAIKFPSVQPGDLIVSINYLPVSKFPTLGGVTDHVAKQTQLTLSILRFPESTQAARDVLTMGCCVQESTGKKKECTAMDTEISSRASYAAYLKGFVALKHYHLWTTNPANHGHNLFIKSENLLESFSNAALANGESGFFSTGNAVLFRCNERKDKSVAADSFLSLPCLERGDTRDEQIQSLSYSCHSLVKRDFHFWLVDRKRKWRTKWNIHAISSLHDEEKTTSDSSNDFIRMIPMREFWKSRGFPTFGHWLVDSKKKWKQTYSWNIRKRKLFDSDCAEKIALPNDPTHPEYLPNFLEWLQLRKSQWKFSLRKRKRKRAEGTSCDKTNVDGAFVLNTLGRTVSFEDAYIEMLLEEEDKMQKKRNNRPTLNISFLFDASLGSDDVVCYVLKFLHPSEHGKLLVISKSTSESIKAREIMWKNLCPSHWTLPKKPRKPWYLLYITKLREEEERKRKLSDDVLLRAQDIMLKGDQIGKIEKLVEESEKKFHFSVDYSSGIVLERNSLLNIAVIYNRHKIVKWLVESKKANIETSDRGRFTPLLNAAWAGDKHMTRYFLAKGANRMAYGTGHYTQGLAPPDFQGLSAEDWAKRRGHHELAEIIRLGL